MKYIFVKNDKYPFPNNPSSSSANSAITPLVESLSLINNGNNFNASQKPIFISNLKHYWPFKGDLNDVISPESNLSEAKEVSFTKDRFDNASSALLLTNGYVQAPPGIYFEGDFTISAWINIQSIGNFTKLLDFGNEYYVNNVVAGLTWDKTGKPYFNADNNGIQGVPIISNIPLRIGQWDHLAFSLHNKTLKIYINGLITGEGKTFVPRKSVRKTNYIGWTNCSKKKIQHTFADAAIGDLRIYDKGLSQSEILALVNNRLQDEDKYKKELDQVIYKLREAIDDEKNPTINKSTSNDRKYIDKPKIDGEKAIQNNMELEQVIGGLKKIQKEQETEDNKELEAIIKDLELVHKDSTPERDNKVDHLIEGLKSILRAEEEQHSSKQGEQSHHLLGDITDQKTNETHQEVLKAIGLTENKENINISNEKKKEKPDLIWLVSHTFERISKCRWVEKLNDQVVYNFKFVNYNEEKGVLLYDESRKSYIALNKNNVKFGKSPDLMWNVYVGKWNRNEENFSKSLEGLDEECEKSLENDESLNQEPIIWYTNNTFERVSENDWVEKHNGEEVYKFKFISFDEKDDGVLLYDPIRNVYVKPNRENFKFGYNPDNMWTIYSGRWQIKQFFD